ncbi:MAG: ABC transporter permease subunit [Bacilli bacterium]
MIKLINNEFIKLGKNKLIFIQIIFILIILLLYKLDYSKEIIYNYIPFVEIAISILYSGIISKEIDDGTIRYYLTKPFKRWKIYLSKYITMIISAIIILVTILIMFIVLYKNIDFEFIIKYLKHSIPLLLCCSIILFTSVIIKNTSVCASINIFLIIFGIVISQILFGLNILIVEYTFLPYLDFSIFNDLLTIENINLEFNTGLSLYKAIIIDIFYTILFYILGNILFIKKDIKN